MLFWIGGGSFALVIIAAVVLFFSFRDRARSVTADEVTAGLGTVPVGDEPGGYGLYVYDTVGFETTDALAGARHDYPARTYLTLAPGGCGTIVRWQALKERWSEWDFCESRALAGWRSYNEWFGVSNTDEWSCSRPIPISGEPGDTRAGECTRGDAFRTVTHEVIGPEILEIGGAEVETLHIRSRSSSAGQTVGEGTSDIWFLPGTVLMVRRVDERTTYTESRIGTVEHHEEYRVELTSLLPTS